MAEHVWSVLCYHASVDRQTNNISLLHVIEQLRFSESEDELMARVEAAEAKGIDSEMELVSYWVRSDFEIPESGLMRLRLSMPSGERITVVGEMPVKLQEAVGYRLRFALRGVPFRGFGVYWFEVERQDGRGRWRAAARVPLHLHQIKHVEETGSETGPGQP